MGPVAIDGPASISSICDGGDIQPFRDDVSFAGEGIGEVGSA